MKMKKGRKRERESVQHGKEDAMKDETIMKRKRLI